ncbi:uncharacterized protein LOC124596137 [Schistocerca americana]|uniref:uncharacterized protein LOC124596137 n=1 Tax=Schistocerca americana TaxID=7009 RepID=UPI001F4FF0B5|nr:uncharacterized protein LOC124596137 [Schistocerca americana]
MEATSFCHGDTSSVQCEFASSRRKTMGRYYKRINQEAKWTQEELCKSLDAIKSGRKIGGVSRAFGIHETIPRTRMKAKNTEGPKLRSNPTFSTEQENGPSCSIALHASSCERLHLSMQRLTTLQTILISHLG